MKKTALVLIWIAIVGVAPCVAKDRPNVLLIVTDDQGYGDFRSTGNEKIDTPSLDKLAKQSTRFERFFVSPMCTMSRASLLSGRYYLRTGVAGASKGLETMRSSEVTVAEMLRDSGYSTACFGKWHLGEHYPNHPRGQGFDEFFGMPQGHWDNYFDPELEHNGEMVKTKGYITDVLTNQAIGFLEKKRDDPFFCYLAYNAPHTPLQVPDRYFEKYKERGFDNRVAAIYGMVDNLDENIGRLLTRLDELNLANDTLVVFLTDNGPEGQQGSRFNAGMLGMKGKVNEGGMRVPCYFRWPGKIKAGKVIQPIAAHFDLLPTLAEFCKAELPTENPLDGRNLSPLILDTKEEAEWPDRMFFHRAPDWRQMLAYVDPVIKDLDEFPGAVRTQQWRAVNEREGWALFDMLKDPGQKENVASANPDVVAHLSSAYRKWFAEVTETPITRPPIPVGYKEWPVAELPASEVYFDGSIHHYNQGYAHDWLTGWTDTNDKIWWDIDVVEAGPFEVEIVYACFAESVGTQLQLTVSETGATLEGKLEHAYPPDPRLRPTRHRKNRFIQTFGTQELGEMTLPKGRTHLHLKALNKPARSDVCDVRAIRLTRIE